MITSRFRSSTCRSLICSASARWPSAAKASRSTLRRLLSGIRCRVFCDVNLRQDFYSKEILEHSLAAADVVKLNDDELPVIASMFGIEPESGAVAKRFGLNTVILTLGPEGCEIWHDEEKFTSPPIRPRWSARSGRGTHSAPASCSTVFRGHRIEIAAAEGNRLAAEVAAIPGAF